MYYLVLIKDQTVSIIRNYKKRTHFMPMLFAYLKLDSIKYVEDVDAIVESGKYCVPTGLRTYQILDVTVGQDGYVFKGERCLRPVSELHICHYKYSSVGDKYKICKEIKDTHDL